MAANEIIRNVKKFVKKHQKVSIIFENNNQ